MSEWISVDKYPELSGDKHLIFDGYEIYMGWLVGGHWVVCKDGITIKGDARFGEDDLYGSVTHWMSLPKPPE